MPYSWVTRRTSSTVVSALGHLVPAVRRQGLHALTDGLLPQGAGIGPLEDKRPNRIIHDQELINTRAALIAGLGAGGTPLAGE